MKKKLLQVKNLSVSYNSDNGLPAVNNLAFSLKEGSSIGIIGESGSGKTSLALAIMGLLNNPTRVSGDIFFRETNLSRLSEKKRNHYRWKKIAMVFQNNLEVLNPVLNIFDQIFECIRQHSNLSTKEASRKVCSLLEMVGLDASWGLSYPHQLSTGMRQRVLIAMALSCDPELLIVDEPTTALDAVAKDKILELLTKLHQEKKFTLILISHEMETILKLTSKIIVMYSGNIVEDGLSKEVLKNPLHPYTRGLIYSSPVINPYRDLWGIPEEKEKTPQNFCCFYGKCNQRTAVCEESIPKLEYVSLERRVACNRGGIVTLLEGKKINKIYKLKGRMIEACKDCDIVIRSGEVVVLIGESGSGKSTLAGILSGIIKNENGEVWFEGKKVKGNNMTSQIDGIQIAFQDPMSATNDNFTVESAVREPLDILNKGTINDRRLRIMEALKDVQLSINKEFLHRKCYMLSGGERQRVVLARSLVMKPKLLIADEISSMLDPSTQANVLRLLKGLQNTKGFAMLYITHDLAQARKVADKVYVMHQGSIIEKGTALEVFDHPQNDYLKQLLSIYKRQQEYS